MNIIILTGNQPRHKFFANSICKEFEVDAIFSEGKVFNPAGESAENKILSPEDEKLWKWHFDLAKEEENNFFGQHHKFNCKTVLDVPKGEINTQLWFEKISQYKPQIVVVYGTSLLKENYQYL